MRLNDLWVKLPRLSVHNLNMTAEKDQDEPQSSSPRLVPIHVYQFIEPDQRLKADQIVDDNAS
jgi:hypothetical protein